MKILILWVVWVFSVEKIWQHWGLWREKAPFSLTQEFELQYQSCLSSDGTRAFFHNCSGRNHSTKLWMYVSNLKCFFLIKKRKIQEREIQTWSPCRDIEAFKLGACLRQLLKLYQLEHWILQTQGIRGLCHLISGIFMVTTWLGFGVAALSGSRHTALWIFWFLVNDM